MRGKTNAAEQRSCSFEILPPATRPIIPLPFDGYAKKKSRKAVKLLCGLLSKKAYRALLD